MQEKEKAGAEKAAEENQSRKNELPNDFFAELLQLPTCKTEGYCSNCGRCER